jgi:hypothetical protein
LGGNREEEFRVSTKFFVKTQRALAVIRAADQRGQRGLVLRSPAFICGFYSPSRKGVSRDSKEIANASDFAEPLTLSAFPRNETRRKIVAS